MNTVFILFFHRGLFFALGARENGLGVRPNFLYAGKTLVSVTMSNVYHRHMKGIQTQFK